MNKYHVSNSEGKFAAGSGDDVLENKLQLSETNDINDAELVLLEKLYKIVFSTAFPAGKITVPLIKQWHRQWLGNIYDWAGQIRTVNISKDNFIFAPAGRIAGLLSQFEKEFLSKYTPCTGMTREQLTEAIAVVHTEFILIHPFREGNGRLSRLIADVMAVQSGLPPLDYSCWKQHPAHYIAAIHAALNLNYEPMKYWVNQALSKN
ncbi:Fic/DOC family protein [Morganella morganii]|uniref:Fic family protein n=1 Tax=bacterium 19GA11TI05 TaxID=2920688 RepID=A0AAU6TXL5_UNCXX|nr:Fic family protein [Morganella morganii]MDW7794419.1 Fic family protein [Morganella morganii]HDS3817227.1 Fic family protein [Morganella morganii subsp. morganii]